MISVLMPTRGRPELAKQAIASLGKGVEVLVYLDEDDPKFNEYSFENVRVTTGERSGYNRLYNYYNILGEKATGDWLMLWNDDAIMETEWWQDKIWRYNHTVPHVLTFHEQDNLFPIISKKLFDLLGHFSLSPHVDSWVQYIGEHAGIQTLVPDVNIKHFREETQDDTYREGREHVKITSPEYNSAEMTRLRDKDVEIVKQWVGENQ